MLLPFLPAIAWAFGLTLAAQPVHSHLRKVMKANPAAAVAVGMVMLVLLPPAWFLAVVLVREIRDETHELNRLAPAWAWINSQFSVPVQPADLAKSLGVLGFQRGFCCGDRLSSCSHPSGRDAGSVVLLPA